MYHTKGKQVCGCCVGWKSKTTFQVSAGCGSPGKAIEATHHSCVKSAPNCTQAGTCTHTDTVQWKYKAKLMFRSMQAHMKHPMCEKQAHQCHAIVRPFSDNQQHETGAA